MFINLSTIKMLGNVWLVYSVDVAMKTEASDYVAWAYAVVVVALSVKYHFDC